jgi:spermidine synthase
MQLSSECPDKGTSSFQSGFRIFVVSLLLLFLELACIRWFPSHVLFLTFFTNTVLLACFLGMSVGCLAAHRHTNYLRWTPFFLAIGLLAAHGVERTRSGFERIVDVGQQASPQMIFFGTEDHSQDPSRFMIPMEVVSGFFFFIIGLAMIGPGQELGRALSAMRNRLLAYTLNILGSLVGIALFAAASWKELSPVWWFAVVTAGLACLLLDRRSTYWMLVGGAAVAVVWLAGLRSGSYVRPREHASEHLWSPYYRIDYDHKARSVEVNLIGHQQMVSTSDPSLAYALPHLLHRDSGGKPFEDVLIVGAGSGNDVSRALQWGARHVDAVEIDPVIYRLGRQYHPDRPYQDGRVKIHIDDGRNFLRTTERQYDLVVYALVDSLVLHSSHSNIRLESYLFTRQAFADVRRHLKPNGVFAMYNIFRQGWLVARLRQELAEAFEAEPLVFPLPYRDTVKPDDFLFHDYTLFVAGDTRRLREQFEKQHLYRLQAGCPVYPEVDRTPSGFASVQEAPQANVGTKSRQRKSSTAKTPTESAPDWLQVGPAKVTTPDDGLMSASDDWPFLYLRRSMIPSLNLRSMALMGGVSLVMLYWFVPRRRTPGISLIASEPGRATNEKSPLPFFLFLGAGFMLVETRAVVQMALLFGSTWIVNTLVFAAVLLMILAANVWVLVFRPRRMGTFYVALFASLTLNLLSLDLFLGMARGWQIAGSCLVVSAPIFFAGIIFASCFARSAEPDRAFGANIAGAILGGFAESISMVLGFQGLMLVGIGLYALSWLWAPRRSRSELLARPSPHSSTVSSHCWQPANAECDKISNTTVAVFVGKGREN